MNARRRIPVTLAAVTALAAGAAAPAHAARTEQFVAYFKLQQRTTWKEPTLDGTIANSCDTQYAEAHGSETATLRSTPLRVRVTRLPGGSMAFAYGSLRRPKTGLEAKGEVEREYVRRSWVTDGPCRPTPGRIHGKEDDVDTSCDGEYGSRIQLLRISGILKPTISHWNRLATLGLDECQMTFPESVVSLGTGIPARVPAGKVFNDDEYVILRARDVIRDETPSGTTTTHVSWTLRMRRAMERAAA